MPVRAPAPAPTRAAVTVTNVWWDRAQDIHLVPGLTSPRLDHLLWIETDGHNTFRADQHPAGVNVAFAPNAPLPAWVTANAANTEYTISGAVPAGSRLLDFLVSVFIGDAAGPYGAKTYLRIHLHAGLTKAWLTPGRLTVRQGATGQRLTVLAQFQDGVYGDITTWAPESVPSPGTLDFVHLSGTAKPAFGWAPDNAALVNIDPVTGVLQAVGSTGSATVRLVPAAGAPIPPPAKATIACATAWGKLAIQPTCISGPGTAGANDVPNVLILPDGFTTAQRGDFERLADGLVAMLGSGTRTLPFNILKRRINYFRAFVASPEGGISPLEPHDVSGIGTPAPQAKEADTSVQPTAVTKATTTGVPGTIATTTRFLLNERDTAFSAVVGERPAAMRHSAYWGGIFNPRRFSEDDFDAFLTGLGTGANAGFGARWARGGDDRDRMVVICNTVRYCGQNNGRTVVAGAGGKYICIALGYGQAFTVAAATDGWNLVPDAIPAAVTIETRTRVAHELGHSFALGDEYGGGGTIPATAPAQAECDAYGNVQRQAPLMVAAGAGLTLDPSARDASGRPLLKWRWPRITKAGILAASPATAGSNATFTLRTGHAHAFAVGDVVRVRQRPLVPSAEASHRMMVTGIAGDVVSVANIDTPAANATPLGFYAPGSILIAPLRGPDVGGAAGPDLELLHAGVLAHMKAQHNPLNAAAGSPADRPCPGQEAQYSTPARSYDPAKDPAPKPPAESAWLVGLWENGNGYDCGVYHPTGACIMGKDHKYTDAAGDIRAYQFCPVCRYILVDAIDPTMHGRIDALYNDRYPK